MSCELIVAGEGRFHLAGELCVFHAAELRLPLLEIVVGDGECKIDLAQVTEVDTAGVQLLLLIKREAARVGCDLHFVNHSTPLLDVIELLNLTRDFGDPLLIPAAQPTEGRHESR